MNKRKKRLKGAWKLGLISAGCAAAAAVFLTAMIERGLHEQEMEMLQHQVRTAAASCYAIEGRFPGQLEYLVENYGLVYDETRYVVHYDAFASNIMPDIDVSIRGEDTP